MILKDIADLQDGYKAMIEEKSFTKKKLCELCIPFRDKYHLSDSQTIAIAREEMSISEICDLVEISNDK